MKNNQVKEAIVVLSVLAIIIAILVAMLVNCIKNRPITYEYAINGKIHQSSKCYERENGDLRCLKWNELVKVDNYYEVKQ